MADLITDLETADLIEEVAAEAAGQAGRQRSVGRNLAALTTGQLFTWTMTLAWTVVVPRWLGPGQMGIIFAAISITGILQIALGAGTGVYVAREIAAAPGRGPALVATAMIARFSLLPVFMGAVAVWAALAHYHAEARWVLYLSGGATALYLLAEPLQSNLQAREEMHYLALANAINKAGQGLVGIIVTVIGFGALGFAGCWMAMCAVVLILCFKWTQRSTKIVFRTTRQALIGMARGSATYWTAGVFFMLYLWIDTAMLSVMTDARVVAWYGVPTKLFQTMLFVPTLLTTAWLPKLVRAYKESTQQLYKTAETPVMLTLTAALPICAIIAVTAGPAIHLVYGPQYRQAVPVLIILGGALVPMYLNIMLNQVCVAAGRQRDWTWLMVGATVFNPAVNAVLIPLTQRHWGNGAIGAAVALTLTELAMAAVAVAIVGRHVISRSVVNRMLRSAVASGLTVLAALGARRAGPEASLAAGVIALPVLLLACGVVSSAEVRLFRQHVRGIAARLPLFGRAQAVEASDSAT